MEATADVKPIDPAFMTNEALVFSIVCVARAAVFALLTGGTDTAKLLEQNTKVCERELLRRLENR